MHTSMCLAHRTHGSRLMATQSCEKLGSASVPGLIPVAFLNPARIPATIPATIPARIPARIPVANAIRAAMCWPLGQTREVQSKSFAASPTFQFHSFAITYPKITCRLLPEVSTTCTGALLLHF